MDQALLDRYAKSLGMELAPPVGETHIRKEKRYIVVMQLFRGKKKYVGAAKVPVTDVKEAREEAIKSLSKKIGTVKEDDVFTFRAIEFVYCDIPVDTILKGTEYDMQCISNRFLTNEELQQLLTN